jgi:hypothetical protein
VLNEERFRQPDARIRVAAFVCGFLTALELPEEAARIEKAILAVPHPDILGDRLLGILETLEDPRAVSVLKCCSQAVVARHIMPLKRQSKEFGFNSIPGTWICGITVGDEYVDVIHSKEEEGRTIPYTFAWACHCRIDHTGKLTSEKSYMKEIDVSKCEEGKKEELVKNLTQLFAM